MKLGLAKVSNFGSFKELTIDFSDLQSTLIYGATGSGKSTLADIPCWILYGHTSKYGNVDDIRAWQAGAEATLGVIEVIVGDCKLTINRVRGKTNANDLFWTESDGKKIRGKDITETQALLEKRLGVDIDAYLAGGYFNDASQASNFFSSKTKERREFLEKITDLSFPVRLGQALSKKKSDLSKRCSEKEAKVASVASEMSFLQNFKKEREAKQSEWVEQQHKHVKLLRNKQSTFEQEKLNKIKAIELRIEAYEHNRQKQMDELIDKINAIKVKNSDEYDDEIKQLKLSKTCKHCNSLSPETNKAIEKVLKEQAKNEQSRLVFDSLVDRLLHLKDKTHSFNFDLESARSLENTYSQIIEHELSKVNPYTSQVEDICKKLKIKNQELAKLESEVMDDQHTLASITQLFTTCLLLRKALLETSVNQLKDATNKYLSSYFDSEISVNFLLEDSDTIDIEITKSGYSCPYKQLSKGQRQLLRLCFSVACMTLVSGNLGVNFSHIFFDEAVDGLDTSLKLKSLNLFKDLEEQGLKILLIDHSLEFQALFDNKILVSLDNDSSILSFS